MFVKNASGKVTDVLLRLGSCQDSRRQRLSRMTERKNNSVPCLLFPARVLACLNTNRITVIACPDEGLADGGIPMEIEASLIPFDLRMPNSEFLVLMRRDPDEIVRVLRLGEEMHDPGFFVDMDP